jgi:hypothetical protein
MQRKLDKFNLAGCILSWAYAKTIKVGYLKLKLRFSQEGLPKKEIARKTGILYSAKSTCA